MTTNGSAAIVLLKPKAANIVAQAKSFGLDVEPVIRIELAKATAMAHRTAAFADSQATPIHPPFDTKRADLSPHTGVDIAEARRVGVDADSVIYRAVDDEITKAMMRDPV